MSGDRGTLPRGATSTAQDREPRSRPTAPGSRRPPRAARERKPALAALALLLIVGGALGAAYLVVQNGQRTGAIEITQTLGPGQRIPFSALREVQIVASGGPDYVPWSEASQVTQFYAATAIPSGTLLTNLMVARTNNLAAGRDVVGLALKDGQLPDGLQVGDHINIYQVSASAQSCPGTSGGMLATNAIVLQITAPATATSQAAIDVRVALTPASAGAVTCNAANNNVAVAVLPRAAASGSG
jgi:hypothetical protein